MIVKELIEQLQKMPQDLKVVCTLSDGCSWPVGDVREEYEYHFGSSGTLDTRTSSIMPKDEWMPVRKDVKKVVVID